MEKNLVDELEDMVSYFNGCILDVWKLTLREAGFNLNDLIARLSEEQKEEHDSFMRQIESEFRRRLYALFGRGVIAENEATVN